MDDIAYLHKDRKSDYRVSFPDFPGFVTGGKTLEEARRMAVRALSFHITGRAEDGEPIAEPSTLDDLAGDPAIRRGVAFLVSVASDKTVRLNITGTESHIAAIDQRAHEAGMTRQLSWRRQFSNGIATNGRNVDIHSEVKIEKP